MMARLLDRAGHRARLARLLADPAVTAAAVADADADPTLPLTNWLARLGKLYGVPYRYLIGDDRLLPDESIRFFRLDPNWVYAAVEGACSIGHAGKAQAVQHAATRAGLHAAARAALAGADAPGPVSGFLLRSQVVPGWPNLEVVAVDADGMELTPVRRDLLSPSIMLVIVRGAIDHVVLREPAIGLHSGIDVDGGKGLRYVTVPADAPAGTRPGDQIEGAAVTPAMRPGDGRVLAIGPLASAIAALLRQRHANDTPDGAPRPFTAAEFALEMVEGTQAVLFRQEVDQG